MFIINENIDIILLGNDNIVCILSTLHQILKLTNKIEPLSKPVQG